MIRARRLFLAPSLSMFLLFIPIIGIPLTIMACLWWYVRNQETIHLYFKGMHYKQNETSERELEKLK